MVLIAGIFITARTAVISRRGKYSNMNSITGSLLKISFGDITAEFSSVDSFSGFLSEFVSEVAIW